MQSLRPVSPTDLTLICRHREAMFREAGWDMMAIATMAVPFREWLAPRLGDGRYFGFMVDVEGRAIGGIGLLELTWPPHPSHPHDDRRGYVLNLYVEPPHRGKGVARSLMMESQAELTRRGLSYAVLHATANGRKLYEKLGWAGTSEMATPLAFDGMPA
jgi:ribosomal protein S18 acetylase RimI-like enzyme